MKELAQLPQELFKNLLNDTITINETGIATVTNPDSLYVVVNKNRNLPPDYEPIDLVVPDVPFSFTEDHPKKQLRKIAAQALEQLMTAANKDGIQLKAVSGYRSYARQDAIFSRNAELRGEEVANRTSARPGQSEHQTGLAMDVSCESINYELEEHFGETIEGKWVADNAHRFGFIIRYLKGKEDITGYDYEPWHLRYIGVEVATEIVERGLTLEEFFKELEQAT